MRHGCLVGLRLRPAAVTALGSLARRLRAVGGAREIQVVPAHDYHMTLRYLGDASDVQVAALVEHLPVAALANTPEPVEIRGLGASPSVGCPRIVLASVPSVGSLIVVRRQIDELCIDLGFASVLRAWHPHVTLARVGGAAVGGPLTSLIEEHPDTAFGEVEVDALVVFERVQEGPGGLSVVPG